MEITLNKENFESEVLKSDVPVLVDFWATWCGPCKIMGPIISEVSEEYAGKLKVGKVDVDQNNELAMQFNVISIPTIKIFKGGKIVGEMIGANPKPQLTALVDTYLM